jgi:diacylglycerol O-acyltransferase / wax synthase
MQQLTPQDAVFLSIETPELPAHIGGLAFLKPTPDLPFSFDTFVEFIQNRLGPIDRFSWRLQEVPFGLDRPYWVRGENFNRDEHIHSIRIPAPYSPEALSKLVGRIFERPLDRSRPLWDMVLIEGLPGGRYVLLWRMHHCLMDGASGANLVEQLFDIAPDAVREAHVSVADAATAGNAVSPRKLADQALRNAAKLPLKQSKFLGQALKGLLAPAPEDAQGQDNTSSLAPATPINGVVGMHRGIAWSTISLEDVKRVKNSLGVTVNDVVLSVTSGAMRGYLDARGELPTESMVASVPCSMRSEGDTSIGNQIREMPVCWATDIEDPIERLNVIHEYAAEAKAQAKAGKSFDFIGMMSEALLPGALSLFMKGAAAAGDKMPLPANTVVSNVPMAPIPLYCAGAQIEQVVPISLLAPTQGLNITVLSYCGELHFGLVHDPALLPDAWDLAGRIPKSLQSLQLAVDRALEQDGLGNIDE